MMAIHLAATCLGDRLNHSPGFVLAQTNMLEMVWLQLDKALKSHGGFQLHLRHLLLMNQFVEFKVLNCWVAMMILLKLIAHMAKTFILVKS